MTHSFLKFCIESFRASLFFGLLFVVGNGTAGEMKHFVVTVDAEQGDQLSQSQMMAKESGASDSLELTHKVALVEEFRSPGVWFQTLKAPDMANIDAYLAGLDISAQNIEESLNIVTPELGGGPKAGDPRDGHKVYMIKREIPGIGLKPIEELTEVSRGSQGIIERIGDGIEWDHSYTTEKGTYCVYRATDTSLIMEHAQAAGVPANPTEVEHLVHNLEF